MPEPEEVRQLLDAAVAFTREAGELTLRHFGGRVRADAKADGTPVTVADRGAEELLRKRILERFPDHGVLGEEYPEENPGARVRWILDPIDGTRSFARGVSLYGVLVGIEVKGEPVVGVAGLPPLDELVAAGRGLGCTLNGEPCRVSEVDALEDALVLTTDMERILALEVGAGFRELARGSAFSRTWGDCYGHVLVATGRAEIMVDPVLSAWDAGPFPVILEEAGGRFTTLEGEVTIHGGSGVSTNGLLHGLALDTLHGRRSPEGP